VRTLMLAMALTGLAGLASAAPPTTPAKTTAPAKMPGHRRVTPAGTKWSPAPAGFLPGADAALQGVPGAAVR